MAKIEVSAHFSSDPNDVLEIPDDELEGLSPEEREDVIEEYVVEWVSNVAASEIENNWQEIE